MSRESRRRAHARLLLAASLALAACEGTTTDLQCGEGTTAIEGVCVPDALPDLGPPPVACPDGTVTVDLNDDGIPEQCLPAPVAGDCDDPPALPGPIERDTLLAEGACFTVEGELAVTGGALLAMQPGVTLTFAEDAALTVDGGYLASLGTAEAPVTLTGGDGPGHWQGVRFAAASAVALEPPALAQTFSVALPDGSEFAPAVHEQAQPVAGFYDYRSASAHTGFEAVDRGIVMLHRDTGTGAVSLVAIHGADDEAQPKTGLTLALTGVPEQAQLAVIDDPDQRVVRDGEQLEVTFGFKHNSDGLALSGLPTDQDWALTLQITRNVGAPAEDGGDGDGIREWVYVAPDGTTTPLPLDEAITLSAQTQAPAPEPALAGRAAFNVLRGLTVEHARAGVALAANDVAVVLDGATLRANQVGLTASAPTAGLRVRDTAFTENAQGAARITPYQLDAFGAGNRFDGPSANVFVGGGALVVDRPVPADVPTVFVEPLAVTGGATLTAEPGANLVFGEKVALLLDGGRLVARAGAERTTLRGAEARAGYWGGVRVTNNGALELSNADLRHAGAELGDGPAAAVRVVGAGHAFFTDAAVADHSGLSLDAPDPAAQVGLRGATLAGQAVLNAAMLGALGEGTRFEGDAPHVRVLGGQLAAEGALQPGVAYRLEGVANLLPGSRLTAGAGVSLDFAADAGLGVFGDGLRFVGSSAEPVTLSGGAWRGIAFFGNAGAPGRNVLEQVRFSGAGGAGWRPDRRGAVSVLGEGVALKICEVDYGDAPRAVDLAFNADLLDCEDADPCADGEGPAGLCEADPLPIVCGDGTEEVVTAEGALECRPNAQACVDGMAFDEETRRCVPTGGGDVTCGDGTALVDGECVAQGGNDVVCGDGTELVDGACVPSDPNDPLQCGEGTQRVGDECVPVNPADPVVCGPGTVEVDGECVPDADGLSCGPGTVEVGGECVASLCGDGIVDADNDEACDGGEDCNRFCRIVPGAECLEDADCGDGQSCDPANLVCLGGRVIVGDCEGEPTVIEHPIDEETLLVPGGCFLVPADTVVQDAVLRIGFGARLQFAAGAALVVQGQSHLEARGTANAPIVLEGLEPNPGYWQGLALNASGVNLQPSVLQHVTIRHSGGASFNALRQRYDDIPNARAAGALVIAGVAPKAQLSQLQITDSASAGLALLPADGFSPDVVLDAQPNRFSTFARNASFDLRVPASEADLFAQAVPPAQFTGDVEVFGAVRHDTSFRAGVPYRVVEDVVARDATVRLDPGAELRFDADCGLVFEGASALLARGTQRTPVVLRGTQGDAGFWQGLGFNTDLGAPASQLEWVQIRQAGSQTFNALRQRFQDFANARAHGAVVIAGSQPTVTLQSAQIVDSGHDGLVLLAGLAPGVRLDPDPAMPLTQFARNAAFDVQARATEADLIGPRAPGEGAACTLDGVAGLCIAADRQCPDARAAGGCGAGLGCCATGTPGQFDPQRAAAAVALYGPIAQDTALRASVPYRAISQIHVTDGATVTLEPGAALGFDPDTSLTFTGARIVADAADGPQVRLEQWRGTTDEVTAWYGLGLLAESQGNVLRNVTISGAGDGAFNALRQAFPTTANTTPANLVVASATVSATLEDLRLVDGQGRGLHVVDHRADLGAGIRRLHLAGNATAGALVEPSGVDVFLADGTYEDGQDVQIFGYGEDAQRIERETTLHRDVPFVLIDRSVAVTAGGHLQVQAGATIRFEPNAGLMADGGTMAFAGTAAVPIRLEGTDAEAWRGLCWFRNTLSRRNLLQHTQVVGAGAGFNELRLGVDLASACGDAAVALGSDTARVAIRDITVRDTQGWGLRVSPSAAELVGTLGRSAFIDGSDAALALHVHHASAVGPYATFSPLPDPERPDAPAAWARIRGAVTRDVSLAPNVPWLVIDHLYPSEGGTLSVLAGAVLSFMEGKGIHVDGGFLRVLGDEDAPVRFTSRFGEVPLEAPARWRGVVFNRETLSDRNLLRHLVVEHAGDSAWSTLRESTPAIPGTQPAALHLVADSVRVRLHDVTLREGQGVGIRGISQLAEVDDCRNLEIRYPEGSQAQHPDPAMNSLQAICSGFVVRPGVPLPDPPAETLAQADRFSTNNGLARRRVIRPEGGSDRWFRLGDPQGRAVKVETVFGMADSPVLVERVVQFDSLEAAEADPDGGRLIYDRAPGAAPDPEEDRGRLRAVHVIPNGPDGIDPDGGPVFLRVGDGDAGVHNTFEIAAENIADEACVVDDDCDFLQICVARECVVPAEAGLDNPDEGRGTAMVVMGRQGADVVHWARGDRLSDLPIATVGPFLKDTGDRHRISVTADRPNLVVELDLEGQDDQLEVVLYAEGEDRDDVVIDPQAHTVLDRPDGVGLLRQERYSFLNLPAGTYDIGVLPLDEDAAHRYALTARTSSRPWADCRDEPAACADACGALPTVVIDGGDGTGQLPGADLCSVVVADEEPQTVGARIGQGPFCGAARIEPVCDALAFEADAVLEDDCESVLGLGQGGRLELGYGADLRGQAVAVTRANERTARDEAYDLAACNPSQQCCVWLTRNTAQDGAPAEARDEIGIPAP